MDEGVAANTPDKIQLTLIPSLGIRLLCWLGIYFASQIPLIVYCPFITWFPAGLLGAYVSPFYPPGENDYFPVLRCMPAVIFGYVFYFVHLLLTLVVQNRKAFRMLMIILTIAVTINMVGCMVSVNFDLIPHAK